MQPATTPSLAIPLLLSLATCSRGPELEPAAAATEIEGDIAYTDAAAVQILAKGDDWEGDRDVLQRITPVYLSVHNRGKWPVQLQYSRMSLLDGGGQTYAAVPPFKLEVTTGALASGEQQRVKPRVQYERFAVAPFYGSVYAAPPANASRWESPATYESRYRYWETEAEPPDREMLEWALPEGVVEPGGKVSGYVYFQRVPADAARVTLRVELIDARSGARLGVARTFFETD